MKLKEKLVPRWAPRFTQSVFKIMGLKNIHRIKKAL